MILGAQGYTIRTYMQTERDIRRSLKKVADIGYTTIQISAIGPIDPRLLRELCDENGLKIVLTHTPEGRLLNETDKVIEEHNILGCDYIGLGAMPERYRSCAEWLPYFAEDFKTPAKKMRDAGKMLMYHNHSFEFAKQPDGSMLIDALMNAFPADLMGFTLDTYWLQAAGCDPVEWIGRLKDRIPCIHLKDMSVFKNDHRMAAVGEGNMNFPAILKAVKAAGGTKHMLVEQDDCYGESPFACLKKSFDNVKKMGY